MQAKHCTLKQSCLLSSNQGSMVVEAAIITPFFLSILLAMIVFVQMAAAEMALHSAVNETTKQFTAYIYPLYDAYEDKINDAIAGGEQYVSDLMPSEIAEHLSAFVEGSGLIDGLVNEAMKQLMLSLMRKEVNTQWLDKERLKVTDVVIPNLNGNGEAFFGFTAEYRFKLLVPFFQKDFTIRKSSFARAWVGS